MSLSASTANNVTGDGTPYTIVWNTSSFDQGSNFNTGTGTFTAPIAGKYLFGCSVGAQNLGAAHATFQLAVTTTAFTQILNYSSAFTSAGGGALYLESSSVLLTMAASDTAIVVITVAGSTKTVGVYGGTSASTFWGYLVC